MFMVIFNSYVTNYQRVKLRDMIDIPTFLNINSSHSSLSQRQTYPNLYPIELFHNHLKINSRYNSIYS